MLIMCDFFYLIETWLDIKIILRNNKNSGSLRFATLHNCASFILPAYQSLEIRAMESKYIILCYKDR